MACVPLTMGERNEAVKTAIKMESATKTLVDNLIAELAQLRRENAEMTMKAELLANEVRRLSPRAPEDQGEVQVHKHGESVASLEEGKEEAKVETLAKTSLETSDESTKKVEDEKNLVKGCPSYTALVNPRTTGAYVFYGNNQLGCLGMQLWADGTEERTCPYYEMSVPSGVHDGDVEVWRCCGLTTAGKDTAFNTANAVKKQNNCFEPNGSPKNFAGHQNEPCAQRWLNSMDRVQNCIKKN